MKISTYITALTIALLILGTAAYFEPVLNKEHSLQEEPSVTKSISVGKPQIDVQLKELEDIKPRILKSSKEKISAKVQEQIEEKDAGETYSCCS